MGRSRLLTTRRNQERSHAESPTPDGRHAGRPRPARAGPNPRALGDAARDVAGCDGDAARQHSCRGPTGGSDAAKRADRRRRHAAPSNRRHSRRLAHLDRHAAGGKKIDVNSASEQELDALPGIGPAIAKNIIGGRPWDDLSDLVKKKAVPQGVFDRDKASMALANINTSSAADMAKTLPGIGEVRSRAIVSGRPYAAPEDLVSKKVLTEGQFDKIKELVAF